MQHHGNKLDGYIQSKGLTYRALADELGIHRNTVENDVKKEFLSMKSIQKYATYFGFDSKAFYDAVERQQQVKPETAGYVPMSAYLELMGKYTDTLDKLDKEREKYGNLLERFFPSAVQPMALA